MAEKYFVISDIHGKYEMFVQALTEWKSDCERLIILGDCLDRGDDSLQVLTLVQRLVNQYNAIYIRGNHESMFLTWLNSPQTESQLYIHNGGGKTLVSLLGKKYFEDRGDFFSSSDVADKIKADYPDIILTIEKSVSYFEAEKFIFVHAGINPFIEDWKKTSDFDFKWIREIFLENNHEAGKIVVFGHTPTMYLNEDESSRVWISGNGDKIGIDGGACFGGTLNALRINGDSIEQISVGKSLNIIKSGGN